MALSGRVSALPKAGSIGTELGKLGREMLVIPAQVWMLLAELAGTVVLVAWRRIAWPLAVGVAGIARSAYRLAARWVTPARGVAVVALAALAALAASQWVDYRAVSVGGDAYRGGIGAVAPAPVVDHVRAGDAHAWLMLPIALAGLVCLALAVWWRPALARMLAPLGLAAIAVALLVDVPKGLDEGTSGVAYQGAEAHLLGGFWLQIVAAGVLIACGLLLPPYARPERASGAERRRRPEVGTGLLARNAPEARA